jgi:hypothetical protein
MFPAMLPRSSLARIVLMRIVETRNGLKHLFSRIGKVSFAPCRANSRQASWREAGLLIELTQVSQLLPATAGTFNF